MLNVCMQRDSRYLRYTPMGRLGRQWVGNGSNCLGRLFPRVTARHAHEVRIKGYPPSEWLSPIGDSWTWFSRLRPGSTAILAGNRRQVGSSSAWLRLTKQKCLQLETVPQLTPVAPVRGPTQANLGTLHAVLQFMGWTNIVVISDSSWLSSKPRWDRRPSPNP